MSSWVEVETTNGHAVLIDLEDWDRLQPLLAAGVRLQTVRSRHGLRAVLRQYEPPRQVSLIQAIAGPHALFKSVDTLDHRRGNIAEAPQTA